MRYGRCVIKSKFLSEDAVLEPDRGLSVIRGGNGSGKTLIAMSLIDSIWRRDRDGLLDEAVWKSLGLDIELMHEKEENGAALKMRWKDGDCLSEASLPSECTAYGAVFDAGIDRWSYTTACFMPSASELNMPGILDYNAVRSLVSGEYHGYSSLYQKLLDSFTSGGKGEKRIDKANDELASELKLVQRDCELIRIKQLKTTKLEKEKAVLQQEIAGLNENISRLNEVIDRLRAFHNEAVKVENQKKELKAVEERLAVVKDRAATAKKIERDIDDNFSQFRGRDVTGLDSLQGLFNEYRGNNELVDEMTSRALLKKRLFSGLLAFIFLAAGGFALSGFLLGKIDVLHTAVMGAVPVLLFPAIWFLWKNGSGPPGIEGLRRRGREIEAEFASQLLDKEDMPSDNIGPGGLYEVLVHYFEDFIEYSERMNELEKARKALDAEEKADGMVNEIRKLTSSIRKLSADIQAGLSAINEGISSEVDSSAIEQRIRDVRSELVEAERSVREKDKLVDSIDAEIASEDEKTDELGILTKRKEYLENRLESSLKRRRAFRVVLDSLAETVHAREKMNLDRLVESAFKIYNGLTGRSLEDSIDEKTVDALLASSGFINRLNPAATYNLVLSVKIALTEFLSSSGCPLPLILDEPFLYMDGERAERLREEIARVSGERQVIVFTHQEVNEGWGNLIRLKS